MPDIDIISLPLGIKSIELTKKLTRVFTDILKCETDAVTIRLHRVEAESYARGGELGQRFGNVAQGPDVKHPENQIFQMDVRWYAGKSPEVQDRVAEGLTSVVTEVFPSLPREAVSITFFELSRDNTYEAGKRIGFPKKGPTP